MLYKIFHKIIFILIELLILPILILCALISRYISFRKIDIGLGPEPLINNIYHKRALEKLGYSAETYVNDLWYITENFDVILFNRNKIKNTFIQKIIFISFFWSIFRYKCVYISFNGSSLSSTYLLWKVEPYLHKLAKIKTVILPYGSDVQLLDKTKNLYFKAAVIKDYPNHRFRYSKIKRKTVLWSSHADHIIGGCDWVDYMYHWDVLMVGHFSIDIDRIHKYMSLNKSVSVIDNNTNNRIFKILHAPNHRNIKGTQFLIDAVRELINEGYNIELILAERKSNEEVLQLISQSDLVVDQLVIGWYAMFTIEAMTLNKPVICYLRDDLLDLYRKSGLIKEQEPPLINANPLNIKKVISDIYSEKTPISDFIKRGSDYVKRLHSIEYIGNVFDHINKSIGIYPSLKKNYEL